MKSSLPKVLHTIGGRSLLGHVLTAARSVEPRHLAVVVRHDRDRVAEHAQEVDPGVLIADQDEVPGTGRAAWAALQVLPADLTGPVLVLAADVPLLDQKTLEQLLAAHEPGGVTILSTILSAPGGYGRIVRDAAGEVTGIVEEKDASPEQRQITEINSAVYAFDAELLRAALAQVGTDNAQGEMYLTDVIAIARARGARVEAVISADAMVAEGVNDKAQLAALGAELNRRTVTAWMKSGVTILDPATTWIDVQVRLEADATILPHTQLHGRTTIATGAVVGPDTTLTDVEVDAGASVVRTHASQSYIGPRATIGPFTYLRPGTHLGPDTKVGAFAETKNVRIGAGSKLPHLAYLGDADVGEGSNIGAGTITANYDGVNKYATTIGSHVRIGADNMLVPPISIGDGAYTGAGTTLREDVPPGALAVPQAGGAHVSQHNITGWTLERRPGSAAAEAAAAALADDPTADTDDPQEPR